MSTTDRAPIVGTLRFIRNFYNVTMFLTVLTLLELS
jgi:hypothetical protein